MKKINMLSFLFFLIAGITVPAHATNKYRILATTFPIYQITRNIVKDSQNTQTELMLPTQLGCPHDYALTPQDMKKLANADILVINGLGMEEFVGAPIKKANAKITLIDSSAGIKEIIENKGCEHEHNGEQKHCCCGKGVNPHLFASPRMAAKLARNIAEGLGKANPKEKDLYRKNALAYAQKLNRLADEMLALTKRLKNNKIVQPHGAFDYLARDAKLEIVATMLAHGQQPSAAGLRFLVKTIKNSQAGAIFTEPQYPSKVGSTLSKETGLPVAVLDPVATGTEDAPLDYYETVMRHNMKTLEQALKLK